METIDVLLPDLRGGGAERLGLLLAKEFLARGHAVEIVLMRAEGDLLPLVPDGARIVDLKAPRLRGALLPLARHLRRTRPDALLAAMWPLTSVAVWARDLARVPTRVVVSDHTDFMAAPAYKQPVARFRMRQVMKWSYPRAQAVVAVSNGAAQSLASLAELPRDRINVIHNPVLPSSAADRTAECPFAKEWSEHDGPRLIAVGSLIPAKDYELLLAAFAKIQQQTNARLVILGEGPLRGKLEALRRQMGLEHVVDMPGFVPNPYPYLTRADLLVLSSAWEGFGNVIVEALACGTPVVSTDCRSGPREILQDGDYGTLVPVGDAGALADAIVMSLKTPSDKADLIRRSRDFSIESAASAYLNLLIPREERDRMQPTPPAQIGA